MKKNVIINEILRLLRNCNSYLPWEETASHISYFMKRLQFSGYDQSFRYDVLKRAMKKYGSKLLSDDEAYIITENTNKGPRRKQKWLGKADAMMFVQATNNEELRKEVQRCAEKNKVNIKVVEKVEHNMKRELQKSNPFKTIICCREDCILCKMNSGVDCRTRACVYEMKCEECRRIYIGQTGTSIQQRMNKHFNDWERKDEKSPLHRHSQIFHDNKRFPINVRILRECFGDPTGRKIAEAVLINELSTDQTMNGKKEWSYIKLNKLSTYADNGT